MLTIGMRISHMCSNRITMSDSEEYYSASEDWEEDRLSNQGEKARRELEEVIKKKAELEEEISREEAKRLARREEEKEARRKRGR